MNQKISWKIIRKMPIALQKILGFSIYPFSRHESLRVLEPGLNFIGAISGVDFDFTSRILKNKKDYQKLTSSLLALYNNYTDLDGLKSLKRHRLMYFDLKSYLVDDILSLLDKMTMAASIEGRVPLLDYRIVEAAFRIPDEIKFYKGKLKGLFRETLKDILPAEILNLPKAGLAGSTSFWVNTLKKSMEQKIIHEAPPIYEEIFDLAVLRKILREEIKPAYAETVFSLYIFSLWSNRQLTNI